jgi:hypothetical protein
VPQSTRQRSETAPGHSRRSEPSSPGGRPAAILALQSSAGNAAVARLVRGRVSGDRRLQRVDLPVALDQMLARTALATTPLHLPTADLIAWASALDAKLMGDEVPGRFRRSAAATQLLEVHAEVRARMTRAPLDADLVPVEPGLPWRAGDPLAGTLEVFPPFDHVGAWREIAAEAPLTPRHLRPPDPITPEPVRAEPPASGERRRDHRRDEASGSRFGGGEATRAFEQREEAEEHLSPHGQAVEGVGWAAEVAGHFLAPQAAFVLGLTGPVLALVGYWLAFENIFARHEAEVKVFGARTALWGMLGTAEREAVPQPLEGRHLLYGARLHMPDWYHKRNEVAAHVILDWQGVQELVNRGCDDIAGRLQALIRTHSEEYTRTAMAAGRAPDEVRRDIQAGSKVVLRRAGAEGLEQIRERYASLEHVSH